MLSDLGYPDHELSLLIVDDSQIEIINVEYLQHAGPTNVISFSMHEGEYSQVSPFLLGDVVISADTAEKEADFAGNSFRQRLIELLIHGILHLTGFDHEQDEAQAQIMEAKSRDLLELIRNTVPRSGISLSCI
ncbi:MAG: rRNA maturation RNase YbeY [Desulfatirhabdiaceae bacterium]|nr:rRNA maturation RNase YbeY [Desulfatirhabdiaceae bacterium]